MATSVGWWVSLAKGVAHRAKGDIRGKLRFANDLTYLLCGLFVRVTVPANRSGS